MLDARGDIEADTLLKVVLVLAIIWLALEVLEVLFETLRFILAPLPKVFGILLIVLVILYLLERL